MVSNLRNNSAAGHRQPALFCVIAFACGILIDRQFSETENGPSLGIWISFALFCLLLWGYLFRCSRSFQKWLLPAKFALLFSCGGMIHHLQWNTTSPDSLIRFAGKESTPVRLIVRIESEPVLLINKSPQYTSAWSKEDRTRCTIQVLELIHQAGTTKVSGKTLLTISGDATFLRPGDTVYLIGKLRSLSPALNPAGFDFSLLMRQKGIRGSIFCSSPEALQKLSSTSWNWAHFVIRPQQKIRRAIRMIYARYLADNSAGIAQALLLGERHSLEDEVTFSFRRSGLMHLLSISGLHVGLIGWLCLILARLFNFSQRSLLFSLLTGITFCLILAELRPPVLRAWLIGIVFIAGWAIQRKVGFLQSLSLAAWLILIVNPAWLFDRGTQLSFLAMLGIFGLWQLLPGLFSEVADVFDSQEDSVSFVSTSRYLFRYVKKYFLQSLVISLAITVLAIPLLANSFDRVTLTGIPATIISLPILAISLTLLLLLGLAGMISSTLAGWIAIPAEFFLKMLNGIADLFSGENFLQWSTSRPDEWFLVGLYALLVFAFIYSSRSSHRYKSWLIAGWLISVVAGLDGAEIINRRYGWKGASQQLECRALGVGHGNACVVKCPNGKTILIDAGSMENGQFAASVVQANLADMGADRLDAILLSHTDLDHLNAIPFLIEQIPIREILLNPVGLNPQHPAMLAIVSKAFKRNIKLRTVRKDDLIELDSEMAVRIKQCPSSPLEKTGNDNADSIVVEIEYRGKRMLFPGDLEDEGQTRLMQLSSPGYDILLAPHHGGKHENRPEFAEWVNAKNIIVSTNDSNSRTRLENVYGPKRKICFTSEGAIRIQVSKEGKIKLSQWQPQQLWQQQF